MTATTVATRSTWPTTAEWGALVSRVCAGVVGGAVVGGLLVGGIGGRLAMLLLRLTSDERLHGLQTDDDFTIGEVSTDTIFLLLVTTLLGLALGLAYLAVRRWLPEGRLRTGLVAVWCACVGGAQIVRPDGVDFNLLDPQLLAIGLFVAIPALGGALMAITTEDLLAHPERLRRTRVAVAVVVFALIGFGLSAVILALLVVLGTLLARSVPAVLRMADSAAVTWVVRVALVGLGGWAAVTLARDVAEIL